LISRWHASRRAAAPANFNADFFALITDEIHRVLDFTLPPPILRYIPIKTALHPETKPDVSARIARIKFAPSKLSGWSQLSGRALQLDILLKLFLAPPDLAEMRFRSARATAKIKIRAASSTESRCRLHLSVNFTA